MSKRHKYYEKKYYGKEISESSLSEIDKNLESDNCYAVIRKVHFDWMVNPEEYPVITRVYSNLDNLLKHKEDWNLNKISDRVYESLNVLNYHLEV